MSELPRFLVSGGSGGIGGAICDALTQHGFTPVVGYANHREAAESVAHRTGGMALALDLTSADSIANACGELLADTRPLAGVVLAGSPPPNILPFGKITAEEMQQQWQVNVMGPHLLLAELVRKAFRPAKKGCVVGILTAAMGNGIGSASSNMGAYVIAKYGMQGMLAVLAADVPWLRVRTVSPGYTDTPMLEAFDPRFLEIQRKRGPFQTPDQIAQRVLMEILSVDVEQIRP